MRTVIIDMKRPKSVKRVLLASFYGMSHKKLKRKYGARAVKKAIIFRRPGQRTAALVVFLWRIYYERI